MEIDPTYENRLANREAWTLLEVAKVAMNVPLSARSGEAVVDALNLRNQLAMAVETGALSAVTVKQPTAAEREPVHRQAASGRLVDDIRAARDAPPFSAAFRTRIVRRAATYWNEATVKPRDAAAWLRAAGKPGLAARVERVAEALRPSASPQSKFEAIEAGDEPRNLSKASPEDLAAWIAAQWAAAEKAKATKGFGLVLRGKLQKGGFLKREAQSVHLAHVPKKYARTKNK